MAFYDEMFDGGNTSGNHYFDGAVLNDLPGGFSWEREGVDPYGERISVTQGPNKRIEDVALHRNGRVGPIGEDGTDLSQDTIVIPIAKLAPLTPALQARFLDYEQTPGTTRRRPGVTRPPR
jgi:hypothetical protein